MKKGILNRNLLWLIVLAVIAVIVFSLKLFSDKRNNTNEPQGTNERSVVSPHEARTEEPTQNYVDYENGFVFSYPERYQILQDEKQFNQLFLPGNNKLGSEKAILLEVTRDTSYLAKILSDYCEIVEGVQNCIGEDGKTSSETLLDGLRNNHTIYGSRLSNVLSLVTQPPFIKNTSKFILSAPYESNWGSITAYRDEIKYITLVDYNTLVIFTFRGEVTKQIEKNSMEQIETMVKRDFTISIPVIDSFKAYSSVNAKDWTKSAIYSKVNPTGGYSIKYPIIATLTENGVRDSEEAVIEIPVAIGSGSSRIHIYKNDSDSEPEGQDILLQSGIKAKFLANQSESNMTDTYYIGEKQGKFIIELEYTKETADDIAVKLAQSVINTVELNSEK